MYKPKIIFSQNDRVPYIQKALENIGFDAKIITFDKGDHVWNFSEFLDTYGNDTSIAEFR